MITSYEVGAVLKVIDEASPVMQRMTNIARELDAAIIKAKESLSGLSSTRFAGLIERLGTVNKQITGIAETSGRSTTVVAESFGKVDAALATSVDTARALKVEIGEIAAASRGVGRMQITGPGGGGGRGGSGRRPGSHGGGGHISGPGVSLPGGAHASSGNGGIWTALAAAVGFGAFEDAELQDATFQLLYHTGLPNTPENRDKFGAIIQDFMSQSGASLHDVSEATKQEARMFKGTPGGGVDVLPEMLKAAWIESRLKGESLEESMKALIGLAHMTKEYDPEAIRRLAPAFAFLSASNPSSLTSIERAAGYAVPVLQSGLEIDPLQTLLMGTVLTRAGATNTKSGTWLRNMAVGAMPGSTVVGDPKKHHEALLALGLIDDKDQPTWFTDGKPDLFKLLDIGGTHAANIPLRDRAALEKQAFGVQGEGAFALLADPAVKEQLGVMRGEMNSQEFKNRYGSFAQEYAANSPLQAARQTWGDLQNVLMDIGKVVLPPLNAALEGFDRWLKLIKDGLDGLGNFFNHNYPDSSTNPHGDAPALAPLLPGRQGGLIHKESYNPAGGDEGAPGSIVPIHVKTTINLDGRTIGEVVSSELARLSTFPRQAAYGDPYVAYASPDYNSLAG